MLKKIVPAVAGVAMTAAALLAGGSAQAQAWRWHPGPGYHPAYWRPAPGPYWRGGWGPRPGVFAAGVLGVAIGETLANPYYGAPPAAYYGPGYWGYYGGCRGYWRWAPRLGRYVRSGVCY